MRTYAGGGGSIKSIQVLTRGEEGGSEIGDFTAYVPYGGPLIAIPVFLFFLVAVFRQTGKSYLQIFVKLLL